MNKESLLTRAFITLARSVRARQAIAAVLMLFAAPTVWASNVDFYYMDGEWRIKNAIGWEEFCECVNNGKHDCFKGATVKLYEDLTVTTMIGSGSENCFKGTFDGKGHTLTVNYGSSSSRLTEESAALFRYTNGDVTIQNLHVKGTIYTSAKYAAGLIAQGGGSSITIRNCLSSVTINSSVDGDGTHAGFVALSNVSSSTRFEGCRFDGKLQGKNTTCWGGFVGWRANGSVSFQGCIFSPSDLYVNDSGSQTFCRNLRNGTDPLVCSYAFRTLGEDQSNNARLISEGMNVTVSLAGDATYHNMSGITVYVSDEFVQGIKYGSTCYSNSSSGDISINLGLDVSSGKMLKKYNVVNGTLYRSGNPFTLYTTSDEVVISAETMDSPWAGNGTDDSPCLITNEQDLVTLSENVNNGNSYECVLFRQTADITLSENFTPIGTSEHPFKSRYDGNGKKISNLNISGSYKNAGLFGIIDGKYNGIENHHYHPQIYDLTIENSTVSVFEGNSYTGMVVGCVGTCGQVMNCTVLNCTVQCAQQSSRGEGYGTLGGLAGHANGDDYGWIKGNRVIGTKVLNGYACGGLIGVANFIYDIRDNFADATVHAGLSRDYHGELNQHREGAFVGYISITSSSSSKDYNNFYHSGDNLPAVYDTSAPEFATPVYMINGIPGGTEVSGTATITCNGTNYYVSGTVITLSFSNISVFTISGAAAYTISDDNLSATITIGTSDVTFQVFSGTCGDNATWALSQDAAGNYTCLTISGSGAIYDYNHTTDGSTTTWRTTAPWGWDLTSITIGDEITSIGDYAFIGCQHLSKLSLGNGVKSIGTNAFDHCDGLTWVSLPSSVSTLAAGAFKNSVNLQTVYIQKSDGLVSITGVSAFDGCHSSLVIDVPTPALALQYKTASYWSNYAERLRVGFGNYLFSATDEGGTPAYAISNADDLRNLSAAVNMTQGYASTGKTFRQTADIALSGNFAPIANYNGYNFAGTYDGGGHVISGLSISGNDANNAYNGLFGVVSGGTVSNVILMNPSVTATGSYTGALIGRIDNQGSAINCYAYGTDNLIGSTGKATVTNVARARKVTFNDGITVTPDASDIANGFVYSDESYYREGLELSLNVERPGYDAHYSYTDGTTTTKFEVATLTVPAADITVSATFTVKKWAGTGTVDDPYVVEYVSQLNALADSVNSGISYADVYFKLGADISYDTNGLSDTESNFTAIGGYKHPFNGHFDGAKHVISGIRIYKGGSSFEDYYQGLFGLLGAGASVSYVLLSDSRITGYQHVGGIVGNNSGGTVTNCFVLKDVTINAVKSMSLYHGGNVGSNMNGGTVTNCAGAATVTYADGINYCQCYGGIVGENENASIEYCLYTGNTVKGNSYVGAIIGNNCGSSSKVEHCYYTNNSITGKDSDGNELANADCAVGENSDKSPNPESIGQVDYHGLAPKPLFSQMAPQDDEDNSVFVALMARRAAALKAAVPQYDASVTLTLRGRTLNRDGKWHTICLPFDVDLTKAEGVLYGAEARELTNASITGTTLHLEFSNPVEKLIAGTPYIIRLGNTVSAARAESSTLTDPIFANVDVDDTDRSFDNTESGNQRVRFVGSYKMTNFDNTLKSTLLVNGTDSPYYPTTGTNIGAFRAYFTIGDGDNQGTVSITDFDIKLGDDEYTGIRELDNWTISQSDNSSDNGHKVITQIVNGQIVISQIVNGQIVQCYDLNGRKLSGKPSRSGLYIQK